MNESLGYDARALIDQAAGGDEPSTADRDRVRARLALAMVATTGGFAVAATAKAATGASAAASGSLVPGASVVTGTAAGVAGVTGAAGAAAIGTKIAVAVALVSALGGGGALVVSSGHRGAARAVPTAAVADSPPVVPAVSPAPIPHPAADVSAAGADGVEPPSSLELPATANPSIPSNPHAASSTAAPGAAAALPSAAAPAVADELVLLREARSALKAGNPERSLQVLAEHARRFPHGALTEEREAARAIATCAIVAGGGGDSADTARATVARFFRTYPHSLHASRVHSACDALDAP